jgi:two-component system, cell cycle sensor histidine kinase and response regulator CckA
MTARRIQVLLIEDNPSDALLIQTMLREARGMTFQLERASTLEAGCERLRRGTVDVVLLDLGLPDSSGLDTLRGLRAGTASTPLVPVVVMSGDEDEEVAVQAVQQGAQDYLVKGQVDRGQLMRSIRYAKERSEAEEALRQAHADLEKRVVERTAELRTVADDLRASQQLLQAIIDNATALICLKDLEGRYLLVNRSFEHVVKKNNHEILGRTDHHLFPRESADTYRAFDRQALDARAALETELVAILDDGPHTYITVKCPLYDPAGNAFAVCGISTDITERKRLEDQLRHSQKMEAVGRLAGGVAHDFNNLLTGILGYSEIALGRSRAGDSPREEVEEIRKAAERAAGLTTQLLAFSRRQLLQPRLVDLNSVVAGMDRMLRRLIGEDIELVTALAPEVGGVRADPGQIEQVIMNLAVNSRDAMPQGGTLTIETASVVLDHAGARNHPPLQPGSFVMLKVGDTGLGMDEETQRHIFEPFFTTKDPGRGTGLGLSTVYGIVRQSGGQIFVSSARGAGTRFDIYLPRATGEPEREPVRLAAPRPGVGRETILLVEDEAIVRKLAGDVLRKAGYRVLEAASGKDALVACAEHHGPLHLLIADVVLPQMSGSELAEKVARARPETRVLYMSGYTDNPIVRDAVLDQGIVFMQKPFTPDRLLASVRQALEDPPAAR